MGFGGGAVGDSDVAMIFGNIDNKEWGVLDAVFG